MLLSEAVQTVRSMMTGSMIDEVSILDAPYDPLTDSSITLRYGKRSIVPGTVLSVGMNTFIALEVTSDGTTVVVLPSGDGGPNVAVAAGERVYIKPMFTTYSVAREIVGEIRAMTAPQQGLYSTTMFQSSGMSYVDGVYVIDPDDVPAGRSIIRLIKAEYRVSDTEAWQAFADCEWQPSAGVVRVFADPPSATEYVFTFATSFGVPSALADDLDTLGITDDLADIPILGAAATIAMSWEGRRTQPMSQGDSRKAQEIGTSANASLSRQYRLRQRERIDEEYARLIQKYGVRLNVASGGTSWQTVVR